MATTDRATSERARWEQHFAAVIMTGNRGEIRAATQGALAALRQGADDATAKQAGRDALRLYRATRATPPPDDAPPTAPDRSVETPRRPRPHLLHRRRRPPRQDTA